jgi:protein ImuB
MCIWLPNWPSQRVFVAKQQAEAPQESPTACVFGIGPVILYRTDARRGQIVAAANQTARAAGVLPQMPLSQCGSLCPEALVLEHDPQSDLEALVQLAESAQCFSPIVGIETLDADMWAGRSLHEPQSLYLDVTGIPNLFGGELAFAQNVQSWLVARGLVAAISIANQVGQAWGLANYVHRHFMIGRLQAMETGLFITADQSEPDSSNDKESNSNLQMAYQTICIHSIGSDMHDKAQLLKLPIESLRLDLATCSKLHRLGIRRIDQLLQLPRSGLPSRFGEQLLKRIDQLLGIDSEMIQTLHSRPELEIDETFEFPLPEKEAVRDRIAEQLAQLCKRLETIGHGATRLVCRVALEKNAFDVDEAMPIDSSQPKDPNLVTNARQPALASMLQIGLYQPSNDHEHLMWLLQSQLDSPAFRLGGSYWAKGIRTQVTLSAPMVWSQASLFDSEFTKHRDTIAKFIDNVSVRLGRENVVTPVTKQNPLPEATFSWRPMTGWRKDGGKQEIKRKLRRPPRRDYQSGDMVTGPTKHHVWRRPTMLLRVPTKLKVTEIGDHGRPLIVCYPRSNVRVMDIAGPERVESGWWSGGSQRRDYYRLILENGVWLWVFQDLKDRVWFLHGIMD